MFPHIHSTKDKNTKKDYTVEDNLTRDQVLKEQLIEQILCENYNSYYRLALSYVHNQVDAEDIVQEGAYKAIRSCAKLEQPEYAKTWVYRIMLNEIFNLLKQRREHLSDEDIPEQTCEDIYPDIDLQKAFSVLSQEEATTVTLRYFENLKLDEIAAVFDENLSTTKSRLYRALKKLRIELEDNEN